MDPDNYKQPKFAQLCAFASELLLLLNNGENVSVETICDQVEAGTIVNYIHKTFGFKNMNNSLASLSDVNDIMKNKDVSENDAKNMLLGGNGIAYLLQLILYDLQNNLYDIKFNDIDPDDFRRD